MVIVLTAPFRWNRVAFNAGEVVDLPEALALQLVDAGQAHAFHPIAVETLAVEGPPANKLMTPKTKKYFTQARANTKHVEQARATGATLEVA